jgi:hypothetical protein
VESIPGPGNPEAGKPFAAAARLPAAQDEGEGEAGPDRRVLQEEAGRAWQQRLAG